MTESRIERRRYVWYFVVGVLFLQSGSIAYMLPYIADMFNSSINTIIWRTAAYLDMILGTTLIIFGLIRKRKS